MTKYSKLNVIYRLQKWLDSVPGQTFMNYAYSWGASIVILGTLFKLTHLPGANMMLFLGMGTEVFVFFIAAFDRPFDKTEDGKEIPTHVDGLEGEAENVEGTVISGESGVAGVAGISGVAGVAGISGGGGTIIIGGGGSGVAGNVPSSGEAPYEAPEANTEGMAAVASSVAAVAGGGVIMPDVPKMDPELEEATTNYVEELKKLTDMLAKVSEQSEKLGRNSEEMDNLDRTITGICKIYEMQLKSASQQVGTIDQINDQTKHLAEQIAELNKIYARMIEAMTVNMPQHGAI